MSIVCAVQENGKTFVAWDNFAQHNGTIIPTVGDLGKFVFLGDWAVGSVGECRAYNVFAENEFDGAFVNEVKTDDIEQFMVWLRGLLRDDGFTAEEGSSAFTVKGTDFLVAHKTRGVWSVGNDFSYDRIVPGRVWAIGSGTNYVLGAAYVLNYPDGLGTEAKLKTCCMAACELSPYCTEPITVREL